MAKFTLLDGLNFVPTSSNRREGFGAQDGGELKIDDSNNISYFNTNYKKYYFVGRIVDSAFDINKSGPQKVTYELAYTGGTTSEITLELKEDPAKEAANLAKRIAKGPPVIFSLKNNNNNKGNTPTNQTGGKRRKSRKGCRSLRKKTRCTRR
jgi:hypothetical protein